MSGLVISTERLAKVANAPQRISVSNPDGTRQSAAVVSAEILASTAVDYPECRCGDPDVMSQLAPHVEGILEPGMPVSEMRFLGMGCTTIKEEFVWTNGERYTSRTAISKRSPAMGSPGCCKRLDKIRRTLS